MKNAKFKGPTNFLYQMLDLSQATTNIHRKANIKSINVQLG